MRRLQFITIIIVVLTLLSGCASANKPLAVWQTSVESYILEQSQGDYNALRNVNSNDRPSQKSFRTISAVKSGIPVIAASQTDVNGLLLANRTINGNNWYIFLVGTVKYDGKFKNIPLDDPFVKDVRLIALTGDLEIPVWAIGTGSELDIDLYRAHQVNGQSPRKANSTFPCPHDAFKLAIAGHQITVVDQQSQAQWTLSIPEQLN